MFRSLIAGLVMLGVVTLTGGCKQGTESVAEKVVEKAIEEEGGGKAHVSLEDGKVAIETKDDSFETATGGEVKVPDGFPQDVYLPKDGNVLVALKSPEGFAVTLQTPAAKEKVVAEYAAEMKAKGWEEKVSMAMGESQMLSYSKDNDARTVTIHVVKEEAATQVQITAVSSQPAAAN